MLNLAAMIPNATVRKVLREGHPELRMIASEVVTFGEPIKQLSRDMLATMYANRGIGFAAPQIGESLRLIVVDVSPARTARMVLVNPTIVRTVGVQTSREGCLSVDPAKWNRPIVRPMMLQCHYQDVGGNPLRVRAHGLLAACIAHEIDHLDGRLIVDYARARRDPI